MSMELVIISPTEEGYIKEIEFNKEDLKKQLAVKLETYKGMVYSDEQIKIAKGDRADLNKLKKAIEKKRLEVKRQCLAPYVTFEVDVKELLSLIDEPIEEIDIQVKAYEKKVEEEKLIDIEAFYNESIGDLLTILPYTKLFNPKWANVSVNMASIKKEITEDIDKVTKDLDIITGLKSEFETEIKSVYLEELDLTAALSKRTVLEKNKAVQEEYQRKMEEKAEMERLIKEAEEKKRIEEAERKRLMQLEFKKMVDEEAEKQRLIKLEQSKLLERKLEIVESVKENNSFEAELMKELENYEIEEVYTVEDAENFFDEEVETIEEIIGSIEEIQGSIDNTVEDVEMITIPKEEYEELLEDSHQLECLKACGVDEWVGYAEAIEMYIETEKEGKNK